MARGRKELFYIRGDNSLMAVDVTVNATSVTSERPADCSRSGFVRRISHTPSGRMEVSWPTAR
jgi:hypothetical protein